jgi:5'-nucleotidase
MRILLTNDDGVSAPGIAVLARNLAQWQARGSDLDPRQVLIVAPMENMSGMSSAVTDIYEHPEIAFERHVIDGAENIPTFAVDGPPALCAILGAIGSFGPKPDFVLSGINAGSNVGTSILHSGTVGAVLTAAQLGLSGMAVSVQWGANVHYDAAGEIAIKVLDEIGRAPNGTVLNLNVPNLPLSKILGVRRGRVSGADLILAASPVNASDNKLTAGTLHITFGAATPELGDVSDEAADEDGALIAAGFAALTPLRGPHEETDASFDEVMRVALRAIDEHLQAN